MKAVFRNLIIFLLSFYLLSCSSSDESLCEGGTVYYSDWAQVYILVPTMNSNYCAYISKSGKEGYYVGRLGSGTLGPYPLKKAFQVASERNDLWLPLERDFILEENRLINIHVNKEYKKICTRKDYNKKILSKFKLPNFRKRYYEGLFGPKPTEMYTAKILLDNQDGNINGTMQLSGRHYKMNGNYLISGNLSSKRSGIIKVFNKKGELITDLEGSFTEFSLTFKADTQPYYYFLSAVDPKYKSKYDE